MHVMIKMVSVAQLAERQIVVLDVAGSSPVIHPKVDFFRLWRKNHSAFTAVKRSQ